MKHKKIYLPLIAAVVFIMIFLVLYSGTFWPAMIFTVRYTVHGMDISNHQGEIDWGKIKKSGDRFVFIKATEGKDYVDKYFGRNWRGASAAGLYKAAYHYFTLKSSGIDQAKNFINTVPVENGCLPPVIDIEEKAPDKEKFNVQLTDFINAVEGSFNQKPILYVIYPIYNEYIKGDFKGYSIWIRDTFLPPDLGSDRKWLFWQFCDRGKVDGIDAFVDLDVFNGKIEDLTNLLSK